MAYACPHGRPTHVTLSLAELERRFLRLPPSHAQCIVEGTDNRPFMNAEGEKYGIS
jgi:hypothetical protein